MPLTLSHPAAAVALHRVLGRHALLSALVVGSVVPDLVYFLPGLPRTASHSLLGVIAFGLPFGVLCYCLYHWLVAPVVFALLPEGIRARLDVPSGRLPSRDWTAVIVSLEVGALTHVVWDYVTHLSGLAHEFPTLAIPLLRVGDYTLYGFSLLQHASTLLGVGLLWRWTRNWYARTAERPEQAAPRLSPAWKLLLGAQLVAPAVGVGLAAAWPALAANISGLRIAQLFAGLAVIAGGRVFLLTLFVVGVIWRLSPRVRATV